MIRDYVRGDEKLIDANEFSDSQGFFVPEAFTGKTIEVGGKIRIIALWHEIASGVFASFILMAKDAGIWACKELVEVIAWHRATFHAEKIITYSRASERLLRWHRFLGFYREPEGDILLEGQHLNKWVITWV